MARAVNRSGAVAVTVEYDQTRADIQHFWWHHLRTAPYIRRSLIAAVGLGTVLNASITFGRWPDRPSAVLWTALITPVLFLLIGIVVAPPLLWLTVRLLLREGRNRGTVGRHRVTLDDREVREETDYGEQIAKWTAVHRVEQNRGYVFIYTQPGAAHVIPKRAFHAGADAAAFFENARAFWSSAHAERASHNVQPPAMR